jgi:hypothetical protein
MSDGIRNRIKGHRRVRAGDLMPHELNSRFHPEAQKAALQALYREVSFARNLLACVLPDGRLNLLDGHLRHGPATPAEADRAGAAAADGPPAAGGEWTGRNLLAEGAETRGSVPPNMQKGKTKKFQKKRIPVAHQGGAWVCCWRFRRALARKRRHFLARPRPG